MANGSAGFPGPGEGEGQTAADFGPVLESAARLQRLVPDAILVGGSAAALHAGHRISFDHDDVTQVRDRFDMVLEALESEGDWVTNRVTPGKIILGELGGIETGVRQMIRARALETKQVALPSGAMVTLPTAEETLRIKAFLAVRRNQVRDYLDIVALSDLLGPDRAAQVLDAIDDYYPDQRGEGDAVAAQVARQLSDPRPADSRITQQLARYRKPKPKWRDWRAVTVACQQIADRMLGQETDGAIAMALKFRNIDASPDDPVESWPQEGIQAAIERGSLSDWRRIQRAVERAPWGSEARSLEEVLTYSRPYGVAGLMERGLARARASAERAERDEVALRVRQAIARSGLNRKQFAEAIGTSASRLSTYATGRVCPSAAMLVRVEGMGVRRLEAGASHA